MQPGRPSWLGALRDRLRAQLMERVQAKVTPGKTKEPAQYRADL